LPDPTFTPVGSTRFEQARRRLAAALGVEVELVTDAQVDAYLAPGATPAPLPREVP